MKQRVVVTGMGVISPVGSTLSDAWSRVVEGRSGIRTIESYDVSQYPTRFAGLVDGFDADAYLGAREQRRTDAFVHYGIAAAKQAVEHAGLDIAANADRIGVNIGSGIGGIGTIEQNAVLLEKTGSTKKISPFFVPSSIINMVSGYVSIMLGARGPNLATVSACATSAHSIGLGARMIAHGDADVMIVGGAEAGSSPMGLAGFCAARAMSTRNEAPTEASRPWDRDRDGFVLADGAAVLVIESEAHAKARGAEILGELAGFGMSGDAYHVTQPADDGNGAARAMQASLADAGVRPEQVGYINAHATSTKVGDVAETQAIKAVFGDHASSLPVSSTKSVTGHLLGAAGGIEAVFSVLAMRDGVLPPTINLHDPDDGCDLDYVPNEAREVSVDCVLSNSFGFGGTNASLVFRRYV
ncbi:beta-ketoacyl-ACP synthase II [Abyssibacter profundi]|uniref:3-oxoacyl-[acyl-carrier-protein] synthase 2 n=1 Tax=Abyssibacter profundi TaxID=2182787 RepID=A0A363UN96_9GAMM|nr:beta-ketoacyl-ACP synthase II [Abyssibacter profundi]MBV61131.1 beta-ketoacyl-[acyl-carrier-protein] synthase II [Nevskiales bacterium]PWN56892.1 beta-ketoacyl-[acyl-carrier-protein] synthase II [Abyssibacter profundi]